jgi:hypothetical protein
MEQRTEEDKIIEVMVIEGDESRFEDSDFVPSRGSLYDTLDMVPPYDQASSSQIVWKRPNEYCKFPDYCREAGNFPIAVQGRWAGVLCAVGYCILSYHVISYHVILCYVILCYIILYYIVYIYYCTLSIVHSNTNNNILCNTIQCNTMQCNAMHRSLPDENFLGVLLGIAAYNGTDLLQNVIASRPGDFVQYGVFTARFYVEGEWVEVITDTRVPTIRNTSTGLYTPCYGRAATSNDCWITLLEKAYAKALGTYEAIPKVKIHDCLVHLTGGSVQLHTVNDKYAQNSPAYREMWAKLKKALSSDTIVLAMPSKEAGGAAAPGADDGKEGEGGVADLRTDDIEDNQGILPDRLYSVEAYREIGIVELVMLRDPWGLVTYEGEWNETSTKWDDYPDILESIYEDPNIRWRRETPRGYIWISYKEFMAFFKDIYFCKLFPDDKFDYYVARGEWAGASAGGPRHTVSHNRDEIVAAARASEQVAFQRATAAVVIDSDSSWFNNPQFILQPHKSTTAYISVSAVGDPSKLPMVNVDVVSVPRHTRVNHLWDITGCEHVVMEEGECSVLKAKGVESTTWNLKLDHRLKYYVVPHTQRRGITGQFVIRVFSALPLSMEEAAPICSALVSGEWKRTPEVDTTGGPLVLSLHDNVKKDNPKWCQNPQFHLKVNDLVSLDELHIKIIVRRKDKVSAAPGGGTILHGAPGHSGRTTNAHSGGGAAGGDAKEPPGLGLVICQAETNEDPTKKVNRKKTQKTNALGEVMEKKGSTLKHKSNVRRTADGDVEIHKEELVSSIPAPVIQRRLYVDEKTYRVQSSYSSKTEAVIYLPRVPRVWLPNGLILVPNLRETGVKGLFDIEVYSSDAVTLTQLPDTVSHSIAGEWVEGHSGGSHISPNWKKNPKYVLTLPEPETSSDLALPSPFQVKLSRNGSTWKKLARADAVGCMIGFYIFVQNAAGELSPYYETTFAPSIEVATDLDFSLQPLQRGQAYVIMPTTFAENKYGSFILSFIADCEYSVVKEKISVHK